MTAKVYVSCLNMELKLQAESKTKIEEMVESMKCLWPGLIKSETSEDTVWTPKVLCEVVDEFMQNVRPSKKIEAETEAEAEAEADAEAEAEAEEPPEGMFLTGDFCWKCGCR